jgi:hypothetical protein
MLVQIEHASECARFTRQGLFGCRRRTLRRRGRLRPRFSREPLPEVRERPHDFRDYIRGTIQIAAIENLGAARGARFLDERQHLLRGRPPYHVQKDVPRGRDLTSFKRRRFTAHNEFVELVTGVEAHRIAGEEDYFIQFYHWRPNGKSQGHFQGA